jgi:hypothetical protein
MRECEPTRVDLDARQLATATERPDAQDGAAWVRCIVAFFLSWSPTNGRVATSELYSTRATAVNGGSRVRLAAGEDHDASACARRSCGAGTVASAGGDHDLIRGQSPELLQ